MGAVLDHILPYSLQRGRRECTRRLWANVDPSVSPMIDLDVESNAGIFISDTDDLYCGSCSPGWV